MACVVLASPANNSFSGILNSFTGRNIVGEAKQIGEISIIPIFSADFFSFTNTSDASDDQNVAQGFSGSANFLPFAILVIDANGVRTVPVRNYKSVFEQLINALPELMPFVQEIFGFFRVAGTAQGVAITPSQEPPEIQNLITEEVVSEIAVVSEGTNPVEEQIQNLYNLSMREQPVETVQRILEETKALLPQKPEDARLHALYGYATMRLIQSAPVLQQMRMALEAQKELDTALKLDAESILALLSNGWMNLYNPMGKIDVSISSFEKVIALDEKNLEAIIGITQSYEKKKQSESAKEWAKKGLLLDPQNEYLLTIAQ